MMKVSVGLLFATLLITFNALPVLCIQHCTPDSCNCLLNSTEQVEVHPGEDISIGNSVKLPKLCADELYVNLTKIAIVRQNEDIITGYQTTEKYAGRLTPSYNFQPLDTDCVIVTTGLIIHSAIYSDEQWYHWEARCIYTSTTQDRPWTVHVTPRPQQNVSGDKDVQAPENKNDLTGTEDIKGMLARLNESLIQHQNQLHEELLMKLNSPVQWFIFGFTLCGILMLAVHLAVYWSRRRNVYAPVSNTINVANVFPNGGMEMGQRNVAQGTVAEMNSCAVSQKYNNGIAEPQHASMDAETTETDEVTTL